MMGLRAAIVAAGVFGLVVSCTTKDDGAGSGDGDGDAGDGDAGDGDGDAGDGDGDAGDGDGDAGDGDGDAGDGDGDAGDGDGDAGDGDGDTSMGGAPSEDECPTVDVCEWGSLGAYTCEDAECCDGLTCFEGSCVQDCGDPLDSLEDLLTDFRVVGNLCGFSAHDVVSAPDDACTIPVAYSYNVSPLDEQTGQFTITVTRTEVAPFERGAPETIYERVVDWEGEGDPSVVPAYFSVNPSETRLVYWTLDLGTALAELSVVDLETNETTNSLSAQYPGEAMFIDDDRFLQRAPSIDESAGEAGLHLIDVSTQPPTATFIAGQYSGLDILAALPDDLFLVGGSAQMGGVDPNWAVLPLELIDSVVSGEQEPIDIYADGEFQRISRGDPWQHQGSVHGDWLVSPSNQDYTEYQLEIVSVEDGVVSFGEPIPLPFGEYPYADVSYLGDGRYTLRRASGTAVIELRQ